MTPQAKFILASSVAHVTNKITVFVVDIATEHTHMAFLTCCRPICQREDIHLPVGCCRRTCVKWPCNFFYCHEISYNEWVRLWTNRPYLPKMSRRCSNLKVLGPKFKSSFRSFQDDEFDSLWFKFYTKIVDHLFLQIDRFSFIFSKICTKRPEVDLKTPLKCF